jgi:hypothetical protein
LPIPILFRHHDVNYRVHEKKSFKKTLIDFWKKISFKFNNFRSIGWKFEKGYICTPPLRDLDKIKSGLGAHGLRGLWHGDIKTQETNEHLSSYINT